MSDPHCLAFVTDLTATPVPDDMDMVACGGYAAILGPPPRLRATRRTVVREAAARMARLERLMSCGTVIPTLPDVILGPTLIERTVRANRPTLEMAATRLRGRVQFQLSIACDAGAAAAHFRAFPSRLGPVAGPSDVAARLAAFADARLDPLGVDSIGLPVTEGVILNRALLVPVEHVVALDGALDAIDALWTEGLAIRLTGPSPGVSHASLSMDLVTTREVRAALAALSLAPGATQDHIGAARRRTLLAGAAAERVNRMAALLRLAAAAGWPDGPIPRLGLWSESRSAPPAARGAA